MPWAHMSGAGHVVVSYWVCLLMVALGKDGARRCCGTRLSRVGHVVVSYWLCLPREALGKAGARLTLQDPHVRCLTRACFVLALFADRRSRKSDATWQPPSPFAVRELLYFAYSYCFTLGKKFAECPCSDSRQFSVGLKGVRRVAFAKCK